MGKSSKVEASSSKGGAPCYDAPPHPWIAACKALGWDYESVSRSLIELDIELDSGVNTRRQNAIRLELEGKRAVLDEASSRAEIDAFEGYKRRIDDISEKYWIMRKESACAATERILDLVDRLPRLIRVVSEEAPENQVQWEADIAKAHEARFISELPVLKGLDTLPSIGVKLGPCLVDPYHPDALRLWHEEMEKLKLDIAELKGIEIELRQLVDRFLKADGMISLREEAEFKGERDRLSRGWHRR
jgi:hypothetical protein